jgi:hypothetical protein
LRGRREPDVVGDHHTQVLADLESRCQVNGVKRAQFARLQIGGPVEQRFVSADQADPTQQPPGSRDLPGVPRPAKHPDRLGAQQRRRGTLRPPGDRAAQRRRLRLGDNQLDERRSVQVGDSAGCRVDPVGLETAKGAGILCGRAGTCDVVDATVVVMAVATGAVIWTADPEDIKALADESGARPALVIRAV